MIAEVFFALRHTRSVPCGPTSKLILAFSISAWGCSWSQNANPVVVGPGDASGTGATIVNTSDGVGGAGSSAGSTDGSSDRDEMRDEGPAEPEVTGPLIGTALATFDSDLAGFSINMFAESTNLALAPSPATVSWIATDGSPDPGCVKITAPYSGPNQWVDLEARALTQPVDWTGKTLHVRIKVDPSDGFSGTARLYVKTGTSFFFYPNVAPLAPRSGWQEITLPLLSPPPVPPAIAGADPAQVVTFGVDPETTSVPAVPTAVVFYVDSFSIE